MGTVTFSGPCKWARLQAPDQKYDKYNVSVGLDTTQLKEFQTLKVRNGFKLADDGLFYVSFNRKSSDGKPDVVDSDGNPVIDLIGNGSTITVKAETYSWKAKDGGDQHGIKLVAVRVDKLLKYEPKEQGAGAASTGTQAAATPSAPTSNKPRIPF